MFWGTKRGARNVSLTSSRAKANEEYSPSPIPAQTRIGGAWKSKSSPMWKSETEHGTQSRATRGLRPALTRLTLKWLDGNENIRFVSKGELTRLSLVFYSMQQFRERLCDH